MLDLQILDRKEASKHGMHFWVITAREQTKSTSTKALFHANLRYGVAATTAENAMAAFRLKHSTCVFVSIAHQGPIEIQGD